MSGTKFNDAASFPSLDIIYSQEEDEDSYISPTKDDRTKNTGLLETDATPRAKNISCLYDEAEDCRPPDDNHEVVVTQSDVTMPTENKRRGFMQLVRVCLSKDMTRETGLCAKPSTTVAVNTTATVQNTKNNDESSFLAKTEVKDVPTTQLRLGIAEDMMNDGSDVEDDSYNPYLSTLSRASGSTKDASIVGEMLLNDSKIASEMMRARATGMISDNIKGEEQNDEDDGQTTLSSYSYKRAFADNVTLGSAHTSNLSTITDDYSYEAKRRIGVAEAIAPKPVIKRSPSGPVDLDTCQAVAESKDEVSAASYPTAGSYPMPPPIFRVNDASNFNLYENHENLQRIVSFGGGEGFVDEEAAERFEPLRRGNGNSKRYGCCNWFSSAPREVKVLMLVSILLLLVSAISVSIGILLQKDAQSTGAFVASSNSISNESGGDKNINAVIVEIPSITPSLTPSSAGAGHPSKSNQFPSSIATMKPSRPSALPVPTLIPEATSTEKPTPASSLSPTNKPITSPPSVSPINSPTTEPTEEPTSRQASPTPKPTVNSTLVPSPKPTDIPTLAPLPIPTKSPTDQPQISPTLGPSTRPSRKPTRVPSFSPSTLNFSEAPAHTQFSHTIKIKAGQDTYIDGSAMWQNFGTAARIRVDGSPERHAFIGFDTASLVGTEVERHATQNRYNEPRRLKDLRVLEAKLRLYSIDDGGGGTVYVYPNAEQWEENELTWIGTNLGNGPDSNSKLQLGSFGEVVAYEWQEIDVTEAFRGIISDFTTFVIKSESFDGVIYASRERASGNYAPEIVFTLSGAGSPTSSPGIPTYAPTYVSSDADESSEAPTPKPSRQPTQQVSFV